ncbi:sigma 54-interacting transcriptional regulator [Candidatus Dependentiae bacterium]|nr:sigma 54-interacting transcriptional regulator [Candidatus Dependentiae bacterium]
MMNIVLFLYQIISSNPFLLAVAITALICKTFLFAMTITHGIRASKIQRPWFFLVPVLIGAMFSDIAWITSTSYRLFFSNLDYRPFLFIIRLAWALTIIQYQSLCFFLESLTEKDRRLRLHQKIFMAVSTIFALSFVYLAIFEFNNPTNRPPIEFQLLTINSVYIFFLIIPSILVVLRHLRNPHMPKILKKQIKILIQMIIAPQLLFDFIQIFPFSFSQTYIASNYAVVSISTILLTMAFYFSAKKIIGLRFLNFQEHVQTAPHFNFIDDFKNVLEQLSFATTKQELAHITVNFFKGAFYLPANRISLHLRRLPNAEMTKDEYGTLEWRESIVENFVCNHDEATCDIALYLQKAKILIADEIAFSNFYEDSSVGSSVSRFMDEIDADIFLPIYQKDLIIAYILVERNARTSEFYNRIERDEMVVFASYLSNIIHLLQNRNLDALMEREKEIQEELYRKHQEINQYKESIQSFLRSAQQRKIGIIFYKNRRFIFGNQAAKELVSINPNSLEGHPLSKALKTIAHQVQDYRSGQTAFANDTNGNKIVLSGIPHLEENAVIITVYYPEIGDLLKPQLEQIKDPSEWDYLLYLETTQSGKLINQLIPSNSPRLLQYKIELLKVALSKKALLLDMAEQDAIATGEIIHHISLRETLHILKLHSPEKNSETAHKIFGLNPLFGGSNEPALLEKLNETGTLIIQNVHLLELETQNHLAEFMKYGFYRRFKSEQKLSSTARIICTTQLDMMPLVQSGKFSAELYSELKQATLTLPSLLTLSEHELAELAHGFSEQAIKTQPFKNLLELTDQETNRIIYNRPVSLHEFKAKIEQFLVNKSKKSHIYHETQFDPAYNVTDPELIQAARLGKKALKDPRMMSLLWNKFGNQNQIATFLGVNRSSVNRRCKEYNLE